MFTSSDPVRLSVVALAQAIRGGALTATAAVDAALERLERLDGRLLAWVCTDPAKAQEEARALDAEARAGRFRGTLHGVPVAVKDIFDAAGMVTTSGAAPFAHRRAEQDAASVARLRQAGAIVLGKTVTTPFAFADPAITRNPWNLEYSPGGSSSGSAAAVAARMVPLALGTQTIGSVLRPASYCGVVGFKPTHGAISTDGVTPLAWSLDHVGIFTRSVDDAALVYGVIASASAGQAAGEQPGEPQPPRLGIPWGFVNEVSTPGVIDHFARVAEALAEEGARIQEVALPPSAARIDESGRVVLKVETAAYHARWFTEHAAEYPPRIRDLIEAGRAVPAAEFIAAERRRQQFRRDMAEVFAGYDALLTPAAPAPAPPLREGTTGDPVLCAPWTFGGFPAISIPGGLSAAGLPLGIQLVAGIRQEATLLAAARWCESRLRFSAEPAL